jgi:DNA polymerase III epsilon subunit-like protein
MKNVMIDIETLATQPNAIILSIAAVKFNFANDEVSTFSVNIDPKSCTQYGMVKDQATVDWWKDQRPEALKSFMKNQITLVDALTQLREFVTPNDVWWCNGMNFDYPILEWSYKAIGASVPWKYWNLRDARTVYAICDLDMRSFPRVGTYHNALDDCLTQINGLKHCLK